MKQSVIYLLFFILFLVVGCGEEEIPTVAPSDTTPPTIVGTNVLAGKIPVNTPIIVVFSERVDLTSAQRGISIRSSIDAEQVEGVVTLHNKGREVKFTPASKMTSGAYVLVVIGVKDSAGNTLMMPVSIFFGAIEIDTSKPPVDITPPKVLRTIPASEQSVESTGSITVRFDEAVDKDSAQAGIFVSGVEGSVDVEGAVAIFKPLEPMKTGEHTLAVVGVKDLSGNALKSSHIINFEVVTKEKLPSNGKPTIPRPTARPHIEYKFNNPGELNDFVAFNDGARAEKGEWVIKHNTLHQLTDNVKDGSGPSGNDPSPGGYLLLTRPGSLNWRDYTVSADFIWTDDDWWGIMFYYKDELNYYRYRVEQRDSVEKNQNPKYMLEKFVKGIYTKLAEGEIDGVRIPDAKKNKEEFHNLKVIVEGNNIELFFDNKSIKKVKDTDLEQGSIAFYMWSNTGWIDNFKISGGFAVELADKLVMNWAEIKMR